LRVAACNRAAFEWIHHEHIARNAGGMSYEQLSIVGSVPPAHLGEYSYTVPSSSTGQEGIGHCLTPLQSAALAFADASTRNVTVPATVFETFKSRLAEELEKNPVKDKTTGKEITPEQQIVEATAVVGGYNLVSRFLIALDVDDKSTLTVPCPETHRIPIPGTKGELHTLRLPAQGEKTGKTILFVNSLLTDYTMWRYVWEKFNKEYDLIFYDQRGHGASHIPTQEEGGCTMDLLSDDLALILDHYDIQKAHAVIGVSQGGATVLNFAIRHPTRTLKIVACDTQAKSPEANVKAWNDRIELAKKEGMGGLADATIPRWFSSDSSFDTGKDFGWLKTGVEGTTVRGFEAGAAALQGYDLLSKGLVQVLADRGKTEVLLLAGEMDGKLPDGLKALAQSVNEAGGDAQVEVIAKGGHLPMVNEAESWIKIVSKFVDDC
jgi:pimeloyl-ACP methyl ester carboxylesterase/alkylhydroperoxidase family enzyme